MKKFLSILLALAMVLSMGTIAFAEDSTDETVESSTDADVVVTVQEVIDQLMQTVSNVNWGDIGDVLAQSKVTIENIAGVLSGLFTGADGEPVFTLAEFPATLMNTFLDFVAGILNTDRQSIIDKLLELPLVKTIMGWYGYKPAETVAPTETEAPTEEVETTEEAPIAPETGAAAGVAVFASLSVAAAAAFVSKKRKVA